MGDRLNRRGAIAGLQALVGQPVEHGDQGGRGFAVAGGDRLRLRLQRIRGLGMAAGLRQDGGLARQQVLDEMRVVGGRQRAVDQPQRLVGTAGGARLVDLQSDQRVGHGLGRGLFRREYYSRNRRDQRQDKKKPPCACPRPQQRPADHPTPPDPPPAARGRKPARLLDAAHGKIVKRGGEIVHRASGSPCLAPEHAPAMPELGVDAPGRIVYEAVSADSRPRRACHRRMHP